MRLRRPSLACLPALVTLLALGCAAPAGAVTITDHRIARPDGQRHFLAAMPDRRAGARLPVVILLHGHGGNGAMMLGLQSFGGYPSPQWADRPRAGTSCCWRRTASPPATARARGTIAAAMPPPTRRRTTSA